MLLAADMLVRLEYVPHDSTTPVNSLVVGDDFDLNVYVQDNRGAAATGVFRAYFDFAYNNTLADDIGSISHGPDYLGLKSGDINQSLGRIDDAGGVDTNQIAPAYENPPVSPETEFLLFTAPFRALSTGTLSFLPAAASTSVRLFPYEMVQLSNIDFEGTSIEIVSAGIQVTPTSGLTTTEDGGTATFDVVLTKEPAADVSIGLSSSDPGEGTLSSATLTFTTDNWNTSQKVTVTGQDDAVDDGDVDYTIMTAAAISTDLAYSGLDAADVSLTNTNDDVAGVSVSPTSGLETTESGGTATFEVVLDSEPTEDVTVYVISSDTSEGVVSTSSLLFTPSDWHESRVITVTGQNDDIDDDDVAYTISTTASSEDSKYDDISGSDVAVVNRDNDLAGITVQPTSDLETTETGGTATFQIELWSQPTANVTIDLTSSNPNEGTLSASSVLFTSSDWNNPKTITITGQNDAVDDDDVDYNIVTAAAVSTDPKYSGWNAADVSVVNRDDDNAEITVTPTSGLETTEIGGTATFQIELASQPTANVTIGVTSDDTSEGVVSASSVVFTSEDWDTPKNVTVTGQNDAIDDGDVSYSIVTAAAISNDSKYSGKAAEDVSVVNRDDDTAGINVLPTSGLETTEAGGTAIFQIVLETQPTADVTIGLTSSDPSEGTLSLESVTFTSSNWDTHQTVTVTGQDDAIDDDDVGYLIVTAAAVSSDSVYNGMNGADVSLVNHDNDEAGIFVSPTSDLETTEDGGTTTFGVVLGSQPTADVTISLTSNDTSEGTVSLASVVFTSSNWSTAQTVTVTGQDDFLDDDDVGYAIVTGTAASSDPKYGGMDVADVSIVNLDDDAAGVTVSPTAGIETTEAGGSDTFTVVLTSEPTADVTIGLTSSNMAEGTVSPADLLFTPTNWATPQTVTVTGQDDFVDDGDTAFTIVTGAAESDDPNYDSKPVDDVAALNVDDDTAGILVTPPSGLETSESGHTDTFEIELASQPIANVTIVLVSSNENEGKASPASVTFTPDNWNTRQTVTVTGQDDAVQDGDADYSIVLQPATSSDPGYDGLDGADVLAVNLDNDIPEFYVLPRTGLETTEGGGTASFEVSLRMQPTADVTVSLSSSNTAEGLASETSLTFTSENWAIPQEVVVTGQDESVDDDDVSYTIILDPAVSVDPNYNNLDPNDVSLTNIDDDTAGISVLPTAELETTESGGTATFEIILTSEPTANVTIGLASDDITEGSLSSTSVLFDSSNWDTPQTITITGLDDAIDDGNVGYSIVTAPASSDDAKYSGMNADDVSVVNVNDDTAGINVTPNSGLETTEAGGTATFQIVLASEPTGAVTIGLASDNSNEGTVSTTSVLFDSSNWNTAQTVTVTGQDDAIDDGNVSYSIVTEAAESSDAKYDGMSVEDVSVVNLDNDAAGVIVSPTGELETTEAGDTDTFEIVLNSQPTANVTVELMSSNAGEGTVSTESLLFTPSNWSVSQTVTITGQDDAVDDDDVDYTIITAATSNDPKYDGVNVADVSVTNRDDDTAGINVSPTSELETTEAGGTATFQIVLTSQPTDDVTIGLASSDTTEGNVSTASVTFTSANWDTPQTVTITGQNDAVDDDDVSYTVVTTAATSDDPKYAGWDVADVSVTNRDDDTAGITVSPTSDLTTTEAGGSSTFQIVLDSEPLANVTIGLSSSDTSEGTISATSIIFTPANWNTPQTVTVAGQDDFVDDGDSSYTITTAAATSDDSKYAGIDPEDVSIVNQNDDTAGVVIAPLLDLETTEAGGTATFTIRLASQPLDDVTLNLASSDTGEGTLSATTLTFNSENWNTLQTVTITGQDDETVDGDVDYTISTTTVSGDTKYDGLDVTDVAVANRDNDSAVLTLSPVTSSADEGASGTVEFVFEVSLSGNVEGGFQLAYTTDDDTATTADGDYVDNDGTLEFTGTSGETKTITVTVNGDNKVELDELFSVALGNLSQIPASAASRITVEGSPQAGEIRNDDTTTLTIGNVSLAEGTSGTVSDFTFSVTLSNPVQEGFSVSYATSDDSATVSGGDYSAESGTLVFNGLAGETKTVTVQVNHDGVVERDEAFSLALSELGDLLAPELADDIQIAGSPATGTIENDDTATVSFGESSSIVIEAFGSHTIEVVLNIPGGGTLSESVTVDVTDLLTGSAQTPQDYTVQTQSVTFGAGSGDNSTRQVDLNIVVDEILEEGETVRLQLSLDGDGIGGAVSLEQPTEHEVTITDDPMTATISGIVWVDANNNGQPDANEATVPGVVVTLEGEDLLGRTVESTTITDSQGRYGFSNLPGGTYAIIESQPEAFHDGQESLGSVEGTPTGQIGDERFTGVVLPPAQAATGYDFGEWGLRASYISNRLFLTSTVGDTEILRDRVARGEEKAGYEGLAQAIRYGESVTVQRIGTEVTVTGSDSRDVFEFTPAGSKDSTNDSQHRIDVNGMAFHVDETDADEFFLLGNDGYDDLTVHDSVGNDSFEAAGNEVRLVNDDFTLEALAFEAVRALSESGGNDEATEEAVDFLLHLEGAWDEQ